MNDAHHRIVEPWKSYFGGLERDPEFRAIEVAAARAGLARAKHYFQQFGWKTERGFVFMFDMVSSHGGWWLDAAKFKGARERMLEERRAAKRAELGRDLNELETMEVIANLIADISRPEYREKVRTRKLWFVHGSGRVHGDYYDIRKTFGVGDGPPDFGAGSTPAPVISPTRSKTDEAAVVRDAVRAGESDANKLTNRVFFARHPELAGRKLRSDEHDLIEEWNEIKRSLVVPALPRTSTSKVQPVAEVPFPKILGLDTANVDNNGRPDWEKARREAGIEFAFFRSNWGTWPDPDYPREWQRMKAAGLVRGPYLFLRFHDRKHGDAPSPEAQARAMVKTVGTLDESDFPPTLDVEFPGNGRVETNLSARQCLEHVRIAWRILKDAFGVAPIIYTSRRVWEEDLGDPPAPDLVESPLWVTRYITDYRKPAITAVERIGAPRVPRPWGDATNWWFHQYQGDARQLPGFRQIDMNRFHPVVPGASGDQVRWVQRRLRVPVSGTFDDATKAALLAFQAQKGLPTEAMVNPATFARLCWVRI
jgi:GH25 family lysozyme M1 (1,4-beta-N-acetylmuramidase)